MKDRLKLAICQMKTGENKTTNIQKAVSMIRESRLKGAEMAILPEIFNSPYDSSKFADFAEDGVNGETMKKISSLAKELEIYIIAGSIPEKEGDKLYNTSYTFDDKGELVGKYRKIHLFDIDIPGKISFKESETLSPGNEIVLIDTSFGKIAIAICYDIRFPELFRLISLKGAKLIIIPAAFNMTTGPAHWELLMRSRAMDNQVFLVAASPARNTDASYIAYGHSMVVDPWGELIVEAQEDEEILFTNLDFNKLDSIRKNMAFLEHRRTDVYELKDVREKYAKRLELGEIL